MRSLFIILFKIPLYLDTRKKNFAITPQSPRKYCYFGMFKTILSKIMNGDSHLLFYIFKLKYLKILSMNYLL